MEGTQYLLCVCYVIHEGSIDDFAVPREQLALVSLNINVLLLVRHDEQQFQILWFKEEMREVQCEAFSSYGINEILKNS